MDIDQIYKKQHNNADKIAVGMQKRDEMLNNMVEQHQRGLMR